MERDRRLEEWENWDSLLALGLIRLEREGDAKRAWLKK